MTKIRVLAVTSVALGCTGLALLAAGDVLRAADHGDSAQVRTDTRADINDVYLFKSPENAANTVMVMTVCPLAGATGPKQYATKTKYQFAIDTTGDAIEDHVYTLMFEAADSTGHQKFAITGPSKLKAKGVTETASLALSNGGKVFAGLRDDPFFFDLIGFKRGLAFSAQTSRNFFDGVNTMSIVLEVPTSTFGTLTNSTVGVWARTIKGKKQFDRMGRPAINTVLITGAHKDSFNSSSPRDDTATFAPEMVAILKAAPFGRTQVDADGLAAFLLPDILTLNTSQAGGFPNGRQLTDDVIDVELGLLSNNVVMSDFVGNDSTFLSTFPYLGTPNP